jgi:titin
MSSLANATTLPAPDPPSGLTATPSSPTEIVLAWTPDLVKNGLPLSSYQVFQGTDPGHLVKIATVKVPGETYTARSLTGATQYYFAVAAVDNANDNSGPSDPVAATTPPEPPAPTNLTLTAPSATTIDASWSWSALPGGLKISRYQINCGTSPSPLASCGTSTTTTFTYRTATAATQYYFDVVAIDSGNDDSVPSGVKTVTTPPEPAAPANVTAVANSATKVTVTWTETIPQNGLAIKSYTIFRGTSPSTLKQLATRTTPTLIDTTVTGGNTYYYTVEATDNGGDVSPQSAPPVSVTTP